MKRKKNLTAGRPPGAESSPYRLAEFYERQVAELDRRQAKLNDDRKELLASIPAPVKDIMAAAAKVKKARLVVEPEAAETPPPAPVTSVPEPSKANGKGRSTSNGHVAQA